MQLSLILWLSLVTISVAPPSTEIGRRRTEKLQPSETSSYENIDLNNYDPSLDIYGDSLDLNNYDELYDYSEPEPKIEVGTLATLAKKTEMVTTKAPPKITPNPSFKKPTEPGLFGSMTEQGLPTCLLCVCLGSSVYCDDVDLTTIPPLPKETTYFYARFNKIEQIRSGDFAGLKKLKRVDLSSNSLSQIDEDAFRLLPSLQELILSENQLRALPELPSSLVHLDAKLNQLQSSGIRTEAFKDLTKLQFLYLSDNKLDYIPVPLPFSLQSLHLQNNKIQTMHKDTFCDSQDRTFIRRALEDIRLDGNPINLSRFGEGYFCIPRLPTGTFH
ncbi:opticin isoform X1 [Pelobates cultripes]|uniref:Opticin isoform X1 n=2 Tax=Pelobates cultripes TaxID=61616 RepID=A0AAD1R100_PELCU|nr:opticin isoform X1 [Pelobates cultripes]CAH2221293.1 opticin isoform X1 [Pelobates cultripes]